ncbi:MAG: hypothetical protein O3B92_02825 [Actinobacteria bacterium]|nr:hypothetical protein [Actinomycetota bacterium]MDA3017011.1 hypothetical protein [Actinomycetota bacterium]
MASVSTMLSGASIVLAVTVRPRLWFVAIAQIFRLAPTKWWARAPFLPIPSKKYIRFRAQTQYGGHSAPIETKDVLSYLYWLRDFR